MAEQVTREGKARLEAELAELKTVKRPEVIQKIKEARAQGDLSENAEYDAAKDEQGVVESRIATLEKLLANIVVIDDGADTGNIIKPGCVVKVLDVDFEEEDEYTIVGSTEANPGKGWISADTPIGKALIGHTTGDVVEVTAPGGAYSLKILSFSRKG